jgi:hypothetical protein
MTPLLPKPNFIFLGRYLIYNPIYIYIREGLYEAENTIVISLEHDNLFILLNEITKNAFKLDQDGLRHIT